MAILSLTLAHDETDGDLLGDFRVVATPDLEVFFLDALKLSFPVLNNLTRLFIDRVDYTRVIPFHEA